MGLLIIPKGEEQPLKAP